jgi:hypothetical protein
MRVHDLKCDPGPFRDVQLGLKSFEVRLNDRDYKVGDQLYLREHHPHVGYIGGECRKLVTYILPGGYGLTQGFVVLGMVDLTQDNCSHQWKRIEKSDGADRCVLCGLVSGK